MKGDMEGGTSRGELCVGSWLWCWLVLEHG